jgi:hypothetical protein
MKGKKKGDEKLNLLKHEYNIERTKKISEKKLAYFLNSLANLPFWCKSTSPIEIIGIVI